MNSPAERDRRNDGFRRHPVGGVVPVTGRTVPVIQPTKEAAEPKIVSAAVHHRGGLPRVGPSGAATLGDRAEDAHAYPAPDRRLGITVVVVRTATPLTTPRRFKRCPAATWVTFRDSRSRDGPPAHWGAAYGGAARGGIG